MRGGWGVGREVGLRRGIGDGLFGVQREGLGVLGCIEGTGGPDPVGVVRVPFSWPLGSSQSLGFPPPPPGQDRPPFVGPEPPRGGRIPAVGEGGSSIPEVGKSRERAEG